MADNVRQCVRDVLERYRKYVAVHADVMSQAESTVRMFSYLFAGRLESSGVLSEMVYCASNLWVLVNDGILRSAYNIKPKVVTEETTHRLQMWMTVLDYSEVFFELAASRLWGVTGKWIVVTCIQLVKTAIRYLLVFKQKHGILTGVSVEHLNRDKELPKPLDNVENAQDITAPTVSPEGEEFPERGVTLTLERSGRTIRKLAAAPPMKYRTWKLPASQSNGEPPPDVGLLPTTLSDWRQMAECLHIARPLAHLASMYLFGEHSWTPWLIASSIDLSSLFFMGDFKDMNKVEREEMTRRYVYLLFYLLRSPFYDRHSKMKLIYLLRRVFSKIPGASFIIEPLLQYLPVWQKVYFYVWLL